MTLWRQLWIPLTNTCCSVAVKPILFSITRPKWGCDRANSKGPSTSFSWNTLAKWPSPKEVKKSQHSSKLKFLSCFPWMGSVEDEEKLGLELRSCCFPVKDYKRNQIFNLHSGDLLWWKLIIEAESFMIRETGVYWRKKELQACVPHGKTLL